MTHHNKAFFYNPNLDTLRAFCVLLVLSTHLLGSTDLFPGNPDADAIFRKSWNFGSFGVTGFFVLSGYLLSSILLRENMEQKFRISNFYARRILRIWPLYFVMIFAVWISLKILNSAKIPNLLPYVTFTANWQQFRTNQSSPLSHFWSVCAEEQFYFVLPLIFYLKRKIRIGILVGLVLSAPLFRYWAVMNYSYPAVWNFTSSHLDSFALGTLLAHFNLKFPKNKKTFHYLRVLLILGFTLSAYIAANFSSIFSGKVSMLTYSFVSILFASVITLAEGKIWRTSQSRTIIWLGKRSFGIYVFHWILIWYTRELWKADYFTALSMLILVILTFTLAELSYRFLERPFLQLRRKFQVINTP